jgi:hypothetical protein
MAKKSEKGSMVSAETKKLKRELTLLPLFGLIYFTVRGGAFGAEPIVGWFGPGLALLLFIFTSLILPISIWIEPGVPDVDPFVSSEEDQE